MKQNIFKAVVATIVVLCTVMGFVSCKDDYSNGPEKSAPVRKDTMYVKSCEVTINTYNGEGVVTTRAAAVEHLDGTFTAVSRHKAVFYLGNDSLTEHTYSGRNIIEARGVLKPRYAKTLDSFSDKNVSMKEEVFEDGRIGKFVTFKDGSNHNFYYSFLLTQEYEKSTIQVENPLTGKKETKKLCWNEIVDLEFLSQRATDLQRDSAGWHAYSLVHSYAGRLSEGPNNGFQYDVHIPLVWVWTGDKDPDFPDDEKEPLIVEDKDSGFDFVNDSTSQSWLSVVTRYTDGTVSKPDTIAVLLKNTIEEPSYQIKQVEDLSWTEQTLESYGEVTDGAPYDKENKISVTPFVKTVKAQTTKCDAIYKLRREGRPIYTDSLGGKHYLPEREWTAKDKSWDDEDMPNTENFERKLLTNVITCTFNEHDHDATGKVELRKVKGEDIKIVKYEYKNLGIRPITPNVQYWTFAEQWAVFSNNKTEKVGEIGTNLYIKTVSPAKQEIVVQDWNINDLTMQKYNATRQKSRPDTIETGIFTITPFAKKNTTRTNKSEHNFTTTYDGTVVFKDKFGQEVSFKALDPSFEDKGGVSTLKDLLEENDYERKHMTSTLAVTAFGSDVSDNVAEVIFKKKVEREELINWDKEQTLVPAGNGLWTSTTTIIYNFKLAGQKKSDPIVLTLDWSIVGEAKSQVILAKAEAPYVSINEGTWGNATASNPQAGVTVYTSKKTVSENYTNLTDKYTATMQTAKYSATVEGKTIAFDFLAPSSMVIAHKDGNLVNGNRTTQQNGSTYDVWDHTGSVTATVTSNLNGNQSQDATDEKEVLVKKDVRPSTDYDVDDLERYFVISKVKNNAGWADAVMFLTKTHVFTVVNSYNKDGNFAGRTTDMVERSRVVVSGQVNSILYDSQTGHYLPALTASDHEGWSTEGFIDGRAVVCDRSNQQAIDEGIKNFVGSSTSVPTPFITQVTASPRTWHDKNFVTVTWKTSTTTGSVSVGSN